MVESMAIEASPSFQNLDLHEFRSRLSKLVEFQRCLEDDEASSSQNSLGSEKLLKDCALHLESRLQEVVSECFDVDSLMETEDLDAYTEHLKKELIMVEAESSSIYNEIEVLRRTHMEDSNRLKTDLEVLKCSLDHFTSQEPEKAIYNRCSVNGEDQMNKIDKHGCHDFEVLELDSQIEKNKRILKSFQELDEVFKSFDIIEQIDSAFGGLKVIELAENFIRLSLQTHIPYLEELSSLQKLEGIIEQSELNHELLIEFLEGTKELKNVEIFPGDVHLRNIINASKSFSNSSLEWFVRKVQDRIISCTLRQFVVKGANKSRHFFQYLDQDEAITCNMIGGIDALIKVSQGWPLSNSPLELTSLKSSDQCINGISLSLICKVEKLANSLDAHIRQNLSSFADSVEKILKEQMHLELPSYSAL